MAKGLYLSLMVGPVVPVPVGEDVINALASAQVTVTSGQNAQSGFQLTFNLGKNSPLETLFLLAGGAMPPIIRVILTVTVNGTPEVLIDGVVTRTDISPGQSGGASTLTVTGLDLTAAMDWIDFDGFPFPAMPPEARVLIMIAKYAMFGIIPLVIPSVLIDIPIPIERIPRQQGTDYQYINQLADEVGYVFYLKPGPVPGANVAYWGPEIKVGAPQPALNVDMDAHTNVESLSFNFNGESAELPVLLIYNQETKVPIPIPVPAITPLNPPLGLIPPIPKKIKWIEGTAKLSPIRAALIGLAKASRSSDAVSGSGSLDVLRYGRPLRARELVGVRGAGRAFDGLYYVKSVTHDIKKGEYKQSFNLTRNGLISTVSQVPV
jgi:hypothetical protein